MITTLDYFKTLTVAKLKDILTDFNMVGLSGMRKAELVGAAATLMDGAHLDAIAFNTQLESDRKRREATIKAIAARKRREAIAACKGKSYNERMLNRETAYAHDRNGGKLSPRQERRIRHKRNAQYGKLSAKLTK